MSDNKASKSAEEARLDARQQQLSSYGSTDPPPAYSPHDETSAANNTGPVSGFRAGLNALTSAISKTFCGPGSVARTSSDEKPIGDIKTLEGTGSKDKRPNKNCVGSRCVPVADKALQDSSQIPALLPMDTKPVLAMQPEK
ncbi:uncharacterized protein RHO25_011190 [Cercospora beticola]|uniref:Uncharacterized protein n=1 Tax=Cercospora beticola TaxID=122368 RepID=A0ABZ0P3T6_CERBT|nr:hypothetical protein RHO25_011190 [Cercospora beticola]